VELAKYKCIIRCKIYYNINNLEPRKLVLGGTQFKFQVGFQYSEAFRYLPLSIQVNAIGRRFHVHISWIVE